MRRLPTGSCCGARRGRTSTGPAWPRTGSTRRASCWFGRRATTRSCGRSRKGCAPPGVAAVVGEIGRLPMVAGRRLQLAAERSGVTAFVLRRWRDGGEAAPERDRPSAAMTRWRVAALPSRQVARASPGIGQPRWRVELLRCRGGEPAVLGCGGGRCVGSCISSAGLADRPAAPVRGIPAGKHSGAPAEEAPFATVIDAGGRRLLAAVNPAAAAAGLAPGMPLADALSFLPGLATAPAEPAEDAAALAPARRMVRPLQPVDRARRDGRGQDRDHRLGPSLGRRGGARRRSRARLARSRQGIAHRIAIADTLGAAWALARFAAGDGRRSSLPPGDGARRPWRRCRSRRCGSTRPPPQGLRRVGLRRVGELDGDAARRARPPLRRDGGAAARPGAGRSARAAVAVGRGAEPGGCGSASPSRSPTPPISLRAAERLAEDLGRRAGARRDGRAPARPRLSPRRRPGRAYPPRHRPAEPRPAPSRRAASRSGSTRSIPASASRT